jgi:hypothetical protein
VSSRDFRSIRNFRSSNSLFAGGRGKFDARKTRAKKSPPKENFASEALVVL